MDHYSFCGYVRTNDDVTLLLFVSYGICYVFSGVNWIARSYIRNTANKHSFSMGSYMLSFRFWVDANV